MLPISSSSLLMERRGWENSEVTVSKGQSQDWVPGWLTPDSPIQRRPRTLSGPNPLSWPLQHRDLETTELNAYRSPGLEDNLGSFQWKGLNRSCQAVTEGSKNKLFQGEPVCSGCFQSPGLNSGDRVHFSSCFRIKGISFI